MDSQPAAVLLSGPPGAGKTTVARALLQRFPHSLHIPVDDLREWVVSGIAHPVPVWTAETTRQFALARTAARDVAMLYHQAGFGVVIDDVISPGDADGIFPPEHGLRITRVLLLPDVETALARNVERTTKAFDTAALDGVIRVLHTALGEEARARTDWLVLDTTILSVEQTVERVLQATMSQT